MLSFFLFQFLCYGTRMHIPILRGVQNGRISRQNRLNFQDEVHLFANCLFYFISFCFKCFLFQFLSRSICMHIPILTVVQNGRIRLRKNSHILLKNVLFQAFFSEMKFTCMPNFCLIFWLFILNAIFFSSLVVAYVCIFPSYQGFKMDALISEKTVLFCWKQFFFLFLSLFSEIRVTCM